MPVAILKYKLPEETEEFELAQKAGSYSHVLWQLSQEFFRANIKYGLQKEVKDKVIAEMYDKDTQDKIAKLDQELVDTIIICTLEAARDKMYEYVNYNGVEVI